MKAEIKCKHCSRFLANATQTATMELKCSNSKCKKLDTYKVVFLTDYIQEHKNHDHANE